MSDVYGYKREAGKAVIAKATLSTITVGDGVPALIQDWGMDYTQQLAEVYEVGSSKVYWDAQPAKGSGSIGRMVGTSGDKGEFSFFHSSKKAFDLCEGGVEAAVSVKGKGCGDAESEDLGTITLSGLVVNSIGFSSSVGQNNVSEKIGLQFTGMDVS